MVMVKKDSLDNLSFCNKTVDYSSDRTLITYWIEFDTDIKTTMITY